jgi:hypothetical protein
MGDADAEKLRAQLRAGTLDDRSWRSTSPSRPTFLELLRPGDGGDRRQPLGLFRSMPGMARTAAQRHGPRRWTSSRRRRPAGWSTGPRQPRGAGPRRDRRHHLHRRDRQDRQPRGRRAGGPTSRARACSATSCPSSRAAP